MSTLVAVILLVTVCGALPGGVACMIIYLILSDIDDGNQ